MDLMFQGVMMGLMLALSAGGIGWLFNLCVGIWDAIIH